MPILRLVFRLNRAVSPLFLFCLVATVGRAAEDIPPFRNPDLPVERRVDDLISRLTVQEKVPLLMMGNPAIPRLGIPEYCWWNEALHGVARNGTATVFPQAIALAATWNPALHHEIADIISTEARAKNNETIARTGGDTKIYEGLTIWSPNINILRDPRWAVARRPTVKTRFSRRASPSRSSRACKARTRATSRPSRP